MASPHAEARYEGSGVAVGVDIERHAKWVVELLHEVSLCPVCADRAPDRAIFSLDTAVPRY